MKLSEVVEYAVVGAILVAVVILLFGQALGQPILFGYVETGSMAPTLESGDGFVAIPSVLTGPPEPGDVVVFRAEALHDGGLTTHRIVRQTDAGYITRGDANPFTDQDSVEPPVEESQIVAEALQLNGAVVRIPALGTGVSALHGAVASVGGLFSAGSGPQSVFSGGFSPMVLVGIGGGLIALSVLVDVFGTAREPATRSRRRPNYLSVGVVLVVFVVFLVAPATVSMMLSSGTTTVEIVSSDTPTDNPLIVGAGESTTVDYRSTNSGLIPMLTVVESPDAGVTFDQSVLYLSGRANATTALTIRAPPENGVYTRTITEHRYVPILPRQVILGLHDIHPMVAIAAIDAVLAVMTLVVGLATLGVSPVRVRTAARKLSLVDRLKRRFF
ncbi:signal peptidase I [Haloferax sp. DFSO52]|uniref:signal peptidase I n=1 Tax=Haloferax sp. DFSO52 TaxID=3388505 RepID=UPI003A891173